MTDPADLRHDGEEEVTKQNRSAKTSAAATADEKHHRSKMMPACTTTGDSGIAFSERPYRAAFLTARDYKRLRDDPERTADHFWERGRWP